MTGYPDRAFSPSHDVQTMADFLSIHYHNSIPDRMDGEGEIKLRG
ncbi:MAG TPA: hypothetical protein QF624_10500 [Dehalococcoidia bacterium]|nr:hypothetical protein [Dehalococcoidia bacterium]